MANYPINSGIQITADPKIITPLARDADEEWLGEDITIVLSNANRIAAIVVDFSYDIASVIEYTLDSGSNWVSFNQGSEVAGGQSRFIRVTNGNQLNFRAKTAGDVVRCIVAVP